MRNPIHSIRQLYQDTVSELRKCTWPTRSELIESTVVVIASVLIVAVFVAFMDYALRLVLKWVTVAS